MTAVLTPDLARHLTGYPRAVVSWVEAGGYPLNAPARFEIDRDAGVLVLHAPQLPAEGTEVEVTFSHVRPQPGVGYDQRRYVNVWGTLGAGGTVTPTRATGWDEERVPFVEYCERNLPRARAYLERLSEERGERVQPRLSLWWRLFLATRVPFLTATIVPVLLGAVVARSHGASTWWLVALALAGASCIHLGLNVVNDIYDVESGADDANVTPTMFSGGSRVVLYGLATQQWMRRLAVFFFGAGIAIGLALALTRSMSILWLGMAGVFLSVFYTAPPLRLVYRGMGDLAVAAGFGPIMVLGTYAVAAERLSGEALYASLPVALFVMLILYVNQVPDRHGDARAGKRTLAVRLSREAVILGFDAAAAVGFGLVAAGAIAGVMPGWTALALLTAPLALRVHRGLVAHYDEPYSLMPALGANIGMHLLVGLGLIAGYVIDFAA